MNEEAMARLIGAHLPDGTYLALLHDEGDLYRTAERSPRSFWLNPEQLDPLPEPRLLWEARRVLEYLNTQHDRDYVLDRLVYRPLRRKPTRGEDPSTLIDTNADLLFSYRVHEPTGRAWGDESLRSMIPKLLEEHRVLPSLVMVEPEIAKSPTHYVVVPHDFEDAELFVSYPLSQQRWRLDASAVDWYATLADPTRERIIRHLGAHLRNLPAASHPAFHAFLDHHHIRKVDVHLAALAFS